MTLIISTACFISGSKFLLASFTQGAGGRSNSAYSPALPEPAGCGRGRRGGRWAEGLRCRQCQGRFGSPQPHRACPQASGVPALAQRPPPGVMAAQRRERAGVRSERQHRWGRPRPGRRPHDQLGRRSWTARQAGGVARPTGRRVPWGAATVRAQPPATRPSRVTRRRQREAYLSAGASFVDRAPAAAIAGDPRTGRGRRS
jgi:hypothetical protein